MRKKRNRRKFIMSKKFAKLVEIRESAEELDTIAQNAKLHLEKEFNITIPEHKAIPTIAYAMLREAMAYLAKAKAEGQDVEINFLQLFDLGVSHREAEDAEKDGNFTPYVRPGQEFKLIIKDDGETEE